MCTGAGEGSSSNRLVCLKADSVKFYSARNLVCDEDELLRSENNNTKLFGILTIVLGLLAIAAPLVAGMSVAFLVGLFVLTGGVARMVWALQARSLGKNLFGFAIGALTLVCGIVLVEEFTLGSKVANFFAGIPFIHTSSRE